MHSSSGFTDSMSIGADTPHSGHRILVVEDEPSINDVVATALRFRGHRVNQADDGIAGLEIALGASHDLIVLDVMLPGLDGFAICKRLRAEDRNVPVLFLTARDEPDDRIQGFVSGGDDYLVKPFSVDELVLRVDAILRRTQAEAPADVLRVDDLALDVTGRTASRADRAIDLTPTEFELLHYLMVNAGVVVSKAQILVNVWDEDFDGTENVVELYVGYLRRKIDDGGRPLIHTKRGVGYVLKTES